MRIIEILPELDIGGVEKHVIDLSNGLSLRGDDVLVVSAGGKMRGQLAPAVEHRTLPVHKKNALSVLACAKKVSDWVKTEGWQLIHAHSRVPAWVADLAASRNKIPFIVTAHSDFSNKKRWVYRPYCRAQRVICVSNAVREGMKTCFYENTEVILNGLSAPRSAWKKPAGEETSFLFVGRLSEVKGLQDVLQALPESGDWSLDVIGDGPMCEELRKLAASRRFKQRVTFHGYAEPGICDEYMAKSSCFLFPSHQEGMPLTLLRAVQIGIPVLASDIGPVAELCLTPESLIPVRGAAEWGEALRRFIGGSFITPRWKRIPTLEEQLDAVENIYRGLTTVGQ